MATVNERPFPCNDSAFIDSVLVDHKKSGPELLIMINQHSGGANPPPKIFVYAEHNIPTDCNGYFMKITFDHTSTSNDDINVEFPVWPAQDPKPTSKSGEVYYSIALVLGIRDRKNATRLELRKAIETVAGGTYVTVVIKGLNNIGASVFSANVSSVFPIEKDNI